MFESKEFVSAAKECASTIDFVVTSVGPDMDILFAQLCEMATETQNFYKVRPEHWTVLGQSLIDAMEKSLDTEFDDEARDAWVQVFDHISAAMIKFFKPSRRASMQ